LSTTSVRRVVSDDRYRCSFDTVAELYERARPLYADEAVAWIARRLPFERVLDLAAGTGKLTRQLVATGAEVVAVEPGDVMRAVLERVVPEAQALAGSAEAIPLPDASVDAVTVGQAFHWFREGEALAEMHRVLRPGGGFALFWNTWDSGDPLLHALSELIDPLRPPESGDDGWKERYDRRLFGELEERAFSQERRLTTDELAEWVASTSAVATADRATQERVEAEVRALAGGDVVEVAIRTDVVVADRV
jgi:ubiquinone/menaquinone biosynthesis C-methylase UbiE